MEEDEVRNRIKELVDTTENIELLQYMLRYFEAMKKEWD